MAHIDRPPGTCALAHAGLTCTAPAPVCLRRDRVTDACGLQGAVALTTNPVIANAFAGLATSATAFAAIEVRQLHV